MEEKQRDYLFDNIKGILILLVVLGHLIEFFVFKTTKSLDYVYNAIYLFHMPMFVFVSGYFSKKNNMKRNFQLLAVYALWQVIIYPLFMSIALNQPFFENIQSLAMPKWTYWYMLSLILWKVITPYFTRIKYSFAISIILALIVGFSEENLTHYSIGRTITFYPFFLLGYYCTREMFYKCRNRVSRKIGIVGFTLLIIVGVIFINTTDVLLIKDSLVNQSLYLSQAYESYSQSPFIGMILRFITYMIQFTAIWLFCTFITSKKTIFTKIGQSSLIIYLSHGMIITWLQQTIFVKLEIHNGLGTLAICLLTSFLYCLLLTTKPMKILAKHITNFEINFLLKDSSKIVMS